MSEDIQIGEVLMTWEQLSKPRKDKNDDGKETIKYSIDLMIEPSAPFLQSMLQLEANTKAEKFGANYSGPYRSPFKTDQTKDIENQAKHVDPHGESGWRKKHPLLVGKYGVNLKSNDPIIPNRIVAGQLVKINLALEKQEFYAGCYVYAMIRAYAYGDPKNTKITPGVSFGLVDVCVVRKGEPLASARITDSKQNFANIVQNPAYHAQQNAQMFPQPGQSAPNVPPAPAGNVLNPVYGTAPAPGAVAVASAPMDPNYMAWLAEQQRKAGQPTNF